MNSSAHTLQAVKGIVEVFNNTMKTSLEVYQDNRIIGFYTTTEASEIFTSTEGLSGIIALGEEDTPPSLALEDGYSKTIGHDRHGGAIVVPETVQIEGRDNTVRIDQFLIEQRDALLRATKSYILNNAFYMLNNAHSSSALTLAPDSVELCGLHTWASGATFDNSATAALDADAIDDMEEYAGEMTDPTDTTRPWVHNFDIIIVKTGSDAARQAKKLFAYGISPISVADINIYQGSKTVVETPWITAANETYWFARDSQYKNSVVFGFTDYPSLKEPIVLDNQAVRSNSTTHYKRGIINVPHDWYGSTGTT